MNKCYNAMFCSYFHLGTIPRHMEHYEADWKLNGANGSEVQKQPSSSDVRFSRCDVYACSRSNVVVTFKPKTTHKSQRPSHHVAM